jgi:hypothetical protein
MLVNADDEEEGGVSPIHNGVAMILDEVGLHAQKVHLSQVRTLPAHCQRICIPLPEHHEHMYRRNVILVIPRHM